MKLVNKINPEDYFPASVTAMSHFGATIEVIKKKLTEPQLNMFRKTTFGPLLDVQMKFNGQLVHHMLLRQVLDDRDDAISFNLGGKKATFSIDEFNIITGLWPSRREINRKTNNRRLREVLFGMSSDEADENTEPNVSAKEFETRFESIDFANDEDAVKVALAFFIELAMMGKDKKTFVDMSILGIVDDSEVFEHYNWSSLIFKRTLGSLMKVMRGKVEEARLDKNRASPKRSTTRKIPSYNIKGFAHAFQVWAYEIFSATHIVTKLNETAIPRMLRWKSKSHLSYGYLGRDVFGSSITDAASGLTMTEAELKYKQERIGTTDGSPPPAPSVVASTNIPDNEVDDDYTMGGNQTFNELEENDDVEDHRHELEENIDFHDHDGTNDRSEDRNCDPSASRENDRIEYLTNCVCRIGQRIDHIDTELKAIKDCVTRLCQVLLDGHVQREHSVSYKPDRVMAKEVANDVVVVSDNNNLNITDVGTTEVRETVGGEEVMTDVGTTEVRETVGGEDVVTDVGLHEVDHDRGTEEVITSDNTGVISTNVGTTEVRETVGGEEVVTDVGTTEVRQTVGGEEVVTDVALHEVDHDRGTNEVVITSDNTGVSPTNVGTNESGPQTIVVEEATIVFNTLVDEAHTNLDDTNVDLTAQDTLKPLIRRGVRKRTMHVRYTQESIAKKSKAEDEQLLVVVPPPRVMPQDSILEFNPKFVVPQALTVEYETWIMDSKTTNDVQNVPEIKIIL